jgi:hypothetical protein
MAPKVNKKGLEKLQKAYKMYSSSFDRFNKLTSETKEKITQNLLNIESQSSVEIERQKCSVN